MPTKTNKKTNVPNLRFPEFEGEWNITTLGDCSHSLDYGMNAAATAFDGENRYIRITDIDQDSSKYKPETPVSPLGELSDKYLVKENDILFARTGASTGKTYLYDKDDGALYFAGFLIRANISKTNSAKFIFAQTQTVSYDRWVKLMSMRSGQPGINSQEYASYQFLIPTKTEQDRIANLLTLIDRRIQTQNKIIEEIKSLKNVIIDRLFNQLESRSQSRFSNFGDNWKSYTYRDLFEISAKRNTDTTIKNVLSASQVYGMVERSEIDIDIKYDKTSIKTYKIVEPGDYIIHLRSFQGGLAFSTKNGICSPAYVVLKPKSLLKTGFLEEFFTSTGFIKSLKLVTYGIRDGKSINVDEFLTLKIAIPSTQEQQKIISIISLLKGKVNYNIQLAELLKKQKLWLLNNLLA